MTGFLLRVIAMLTMLIDHLGFGFVETAAWMRVVGRCAFILYAFLMAESYYHLRNKPDRLRNHVIKLALLAVVSEVPYDLFCEKTFFDWNTQNVVREPDPHGPRRLELVDPFPQGGQSRHRAGPVLTR